jgi:hypothetical protein
VEKLQSSIKTSATDATRVDKSIVLNLVGNTVSLQSDTDSAAYGVQLVQAQALVTLGFILKVVKVP